MMPYEVYKLLHLVGIFMVITSLGGLLIHAVNGGTKETNKWRKVCAITHGIGLVIVLVAGFGLLARLGMTDGIPTWAIAKMGIWVLLGAVMLVPGRFPALAGKAFWGVLLLSAAAAYLAINKPL